MVALQQRGRAGLVRATRRGGDVLARSRVAAGAARMVGGAALRVVAYHGVPDVDAFAAQLRHLRRHYRLVSGDDVAAALTGGSRLPDRAVWLTFDDGCPDVDAAAEVMADHGVRACMFVCGGVLDTDEPLWWQVVQAAGARQVVLPGARRPLTPADLKAVPDPQRRDTVADLAGRVRAVDPGALQIPQLSTATAGRWVSMGHEIGNHTWDHPCLDRCTPTQQREQVSRCDAALRECGLVPRYFAYPNGNWAGAAEAETARLGYTASLLFDHRLAAAPLRSPLSRVRLDSDAPVSRARGVVSGAHPWLFHVGGGVQ